MYNMNYIITVKPYRCTVLCEAINNYIKNDSALPKKFLHEMNDRHMTYIIGPNINNHLSISCNTFDIAMAV